MKLFRNTIQQFTASPKRLFLADSIGALVTAILLLTIIKTNPALFGVPSIVVNYLSAIAVVFCLYSLVCFFTAKNKWRPLLKAISISNLLYCGLTCVLLAYHWHSITPLAVAYFSGETVIIFLLVYVEFRTVHSRNF